jgi:hypothetical protein
MTNEWCAPFNPLVPTVVPLAGQAKIQIRVGFEMEYDCPAPTPMLLALSVHHSRVHDLMVPDLLLTSPRVSVSAYRDLFGNWCSRMVAPPGRLLLGTDALIGDTGLPDVVEPWVMQTPVENLPDSTLVTKLKACAATTRTWPSPFAAA